MTREQAAEAVVAAVRAWDATLSEFCDGQERDSVRAALLVYDAAPVDPVHEHLAVCRERIEDLERVLLRELVPPPPSFASVFGETVRGLEAEATESLSRRIDAPPEES